MALYKTINGKVVQISPTEIKSQIKDFYGWSEAEYKRQYNKFRNRYLNYKSFTKRAPQSVSELLYKEMRAKQRYGREYKPSIEMETIRGFSSASTQSFAKRSTKSDIGRTKAISEKVSKQFGGLIENNSQAKEIAEKLKNDPVALDKALSDFADKLHAKMDEQTQEVKEQAIPFSNQNTGSDQSIDFDIDDYIDENA